MAIDNFLEPGVCVPKSLHPTTDAMGYQPQSGGDTWGRRIIRISFTPKEGNSEMKKGPQNIKRNISKKKTLLIILCVKIKRLKKVKAH